MEQELLAQRIARILYDKKALDITVLNVSHLTVITDYMVIASGRSALQVKALADDVDDALAMEGVNLRAKEGNAEAYHFATPNIPGNDYSFSGIKTSFLYFLRDRLAEDPEYIEKHKADLCASIQQCIVGFLIKKLEKAVKQSGVKQIAIAGGVSANSLLRSELQRLGDRHRWQVFIPKFQFCTDNAAMVGIAGYFKYLKGDFADISLPPYAR